MVDAEAGPVAAAAAGSGGGGGAEAAAVVALGRGCSWMPRAMSNWWTVLAGAQLNRSHQLALSPAHVPTCAMCLQRSRVRPWFVRRVRLTAFAPHFCLGRRTVTP